MKSNRFFRMHRPATWLSIDRPAGEHGPAELGDGKRLYFTSSLLARWDKKGEDNEQFVRAYAWDGKELKPRFELDFAALKPGRPHQMLFGATKIGN